MFACYTVIAISDSKPKTSKRFFDAIWVKNNLRSRHLYSPPSSNNIARIYLKTQSTTRLTFSNTKQVLDTVSAFIKTINLTIIQSVLSRFFNSS